MTTSPFKTLRMPAALASEFFALFARLEYALKEGGFRRNARGLAAPAGQRFAASLEARIALLEGTELSDAVVYLTTEPPKVQPFEGEWAEAPLEGNTPLAKAIDAAGRVRNNLFHGGKFGLHSPDGRDEKLVRAAMTILMGTLNYENNVKAIFEDQF